MLSAAANYFVAKLPLKSTRTVAQSASATTSFGSSQAPLWSGICSNEKHLLDDREYAKLLNMNRSWDSSIFLVSICIFALYDVCSTLQVTDRKTGRPGLFLLTIFHPSQQCYQAFHHINDLAKSMPDKWRTGARAKPCRETVLKWRATLDPSKVHQNALKTGQKLTFLALFTLYPHAVQRVA